MKNMKLFPKTFLHCLGLITGIILIAFLLIYSLLPKFYQSYKQRELDKDTGQLAAMLHTSSLYELPECISGFAASKNYGYTAAYEDGEIICAAGTGINFQLVGGDTGETEEMVRIDFEYAESGTSFQTADGETVYLTLKVSLQPIGDAVSVLLIILPIVLVFCILLSVLVAYFYAKSIVTPIRNITNTTLEMKKLVPDASCSCSRNDEIGILSQNINEMYQRLLTAISDLEKEILAVSKAEQEKLDFLLLASHELKTPVTAVRGMIDGMLYNVGVYKDRDTYLEECQTVLEDLTELICRILETSKIDANTAAKNKADTDIGKLLKEISSSYVILAQSRNIRMELSLENHFHAVIPADLIQKAFSNILSNAVKYTDEGKNIRIYMKENKVFIENECAPLSEEELSHIGEPFYHPLRQNNSDSTGLGLYFTDRIFKACDVAYLFAPYEKGMRFVIYF